MCYSKIWHCARVILAVRYPDLNSLQTFLDKHSDKVLPKLKENYGLNMVHELKEADADSIPYTTWRRPPDIE